MDPRPAAAATARAVFIAVLAAATLAVAASASWAEPTPTPSPTKSPFDPVTDLPWGPSKPTIGIGIGDWISGQINAWFANLVALSIKPLLDVLAMTLLATPDVSASGRVFDLWKATAVIANTGFVVFATIGAITAMGHQTIQTRYAVKEVLPRLGMAILATNASFLLCGKIIEIANALSRALLGGEFDPTRASVTLRMLILPPSNSQIFYVLLALVAVVLLLLLLITFVLRSALVLLLVVAAPLALACHALPHTDGLARFWWRAFTGLLIIQLAQSLTLVLAVRVFFNQDGRVLLGIEPTGQLINLVLAICLLIILVRIPSWISRQIFVRGGGGSTVTRMVKYAVAYKLTAPLCERIRLIELPSLLRAGLPRHDHDRPTAAGPPPSRRTPLDRQPVHRLRRPGPGRHGHLRRPARLVRRQRPPGGQDPRPPLPPAAQSRRHRGRRLGARPARGHRHRGLPLPRHQAGQLRWGGLAHLSRLG